MYFRLLETMVDQKIVIWDRSLDKFQFDVLNHSNFKVINIDNF